MFREVDRLYFAKKQKRFYVHRKRSERGSLVHLHHVKHTSWGDSPDGVAVAGAGGAVSPAVAAAEEVAKCPPLEGSASTKSFVAAAVAGPGKWVVKSETVAAEAAAVVPAARPSPEPVRVVRDGTVLLRAPKCTLRSLPLMTGSGKSGAASLASLLQAKCSVPISRLQYTGEAYREFQTHIEKHSWGSLRHYPLSSWYHAAELVDPKSLLPSAAYPTAAWTGVEEMRYARVSYCPLIHVVRHPLDTLSSLVNCFCASGDVLQSGSVAEDAANFDFAARALRDSGVTLPQHSGKFGDERLRLAMSYWLRWNELVERASPHMRVQVEDVDAGMLTRLLTGKTEVPGICDRATMDNLRENAAPGPHPNSGRVAVHLTWDDLRKADMKLAQSVQGLAEKYGYAVV
jgi:hypothetical protein